MRIRDTELGIDTRLTDLAVWNDPHPFYARLRETAPFVRCRRDQLRWTTGNGGLRGLAALPIAAS